MPRSAVDDALAHADAHVGETTARLADLVRIPSVSAEGFPAGEVRRSAEATAALLREAGLENVELLEMPGQHPYVYADWLHAAGAPTLLVYGHHDVQPPGRPERWVTPAFEPTQRNGRLYGRGAVDDKGTFITHAAAAQAWLATAGRLPLNLKVLIEGEEEIGSPGLEAFLKRHGRLLVRRRRGARRHRQPRGGPPGPHVPAPRHLPGGRRGALPGPARPQRLLGRPGAGRRCASSPA